jgi:hypothetical protein
VLKKGRDWLRVKHLDRVLGCESRARIALRFIAIETTIAIFIAMNDTQIME